MRSHRSLPYSADRPTHPSGFARRRPGHPLLLALALAVLAGCRDANHPASPADAGPRALATPAICGRMIAGEGLRPDVRVRSCNGKAMLVLQTDGNVVLYNDVGAVWVAPNTLGRGTSLFQMQHDGNLVAYNGALQALWASNTAGNPGAWLAIQDDCNLVIYRGPYPQRNGASWATGTSCAPTSTSPVTGPLKFSKQPNLNCNWPPLPTWIFCQHRTGYHRVGAGVAGADDTYAWDANLARSADTGKPVYAAAPGRVVKYGGSVAPGGRSGAVLIEHTSGGRIWWSGYLHMRGIRVAVGQAVTTGTLIGYVGDIGAPGVPHLHFVMYNGSNTYGGLRSYDGQFTARN